MLDERYGDHSIRWSDERNYTLIRHGIGKDGSPNEALEGYFNSIESIMKEVAKREADHCETISAWLDRYREVLEELRRAF